MATIDPVSAGITVGGNLLSGLGNFAAGGADRKLKRKSRKRLGELDAEISQGVSTGDLAQIAALMRKTLNPAISQAFSKGVGRFGSGSGLAAGLATSAGAQAIAPAVASAGRERIFGNFQAKQRLASIYSGLAA